MFERALHVFAKKRYLFAVSMLVSHVAVSANIDLAIKDQHGMALANAVVEISQANISVKPVNSSVKKLPVAVMDQVNKQFVPELLIVQQGQFVNFPNSDNIRHNVYSFSQAKPFQLKLYSGQPKEPIIFDSQGVVVLGCNIHDAMVGYIYVANSEQVYKTDNNGSVSLPTTTQPFQISVWHALQTAPLETKTILDIQPQAILPITINTSSPAPRNTFGSEFKGGNDE